MTWGNVVFVSKNGAWIAVQHDGGGAAVNLIGDEGLVEVGDLLKGDWDADGGETVFSQNLQRKIDISIEGHFGSVQAAIKKAIEWSGDNRR
jgi:hypothetical protein